MALRKPKLKTIGGQEFRVGDCRVWAEIFYLDSPTDYREYIADGVRGHTPEEDTLVMLANAPRSVWIKARKFIRRSIAVLASKITQALES